MTASSSGGRARGVGALIAVAVLLLVAAVVGFHDDPPTPSREPGASGAEPGRGETTSTPAPDPSPEAPPAPDPVASYRIFGQDRTLVAYYGTADTGSLGVLGEGPPNQVIGRLEDAAQAFRRPGRPVQIVYELIVTIADPVPGPDGDYSHDLARSQVERYLRAARRHDALLLLDLQPGRADFLDVARRWEWALRDPRVGLALDPEWRMGRGEVPGRVIGSVDAAEVNEVSLWLANLVGSEGLPQKLFVLHQFRTSMIERMGRVVVRDRLATVQHVDGYGTPQQKLATYHAVAERKFFHGFKLFYDEDVRMMRPADVLRIKPAVRFVSYQ